MRFASAMERRSGTHRQPHATRDRVAVPRSPVRSARCPERRSRDRSTATFAPTRSDTGKVVWDFDTVREYETVNGVPARGGSLDGPGPVIAGGMMFVNSGYTVDGGMPGNVVLAFSVDGK